jgi:hypothetical protein
MDLTIHVAPEHAEALKAALVERLEENLAQNPAAHAVSSARRPTLDGTTGSPS